MNKSEKKEGKKMKKIFIFGWFGENNLGDDALLNQTIDSIYGLNHECECILATNNKSNININIVNNNKVRCVDKSFCSLFKCLFKYDIYIFGPGGLFPNKDLKKLVFIYFYMLGLKILHKKILILGVGIENCNFEYKLNRFFIKKIICMADNCTLRYNLANYDYQKALTKNAVRAADLMFLYDYKNQSYNNGEYVCFSLANIFIDDNDMHDFIENLKPIIEEILNKGLKILFLTFTDKKDYFLNKMVVEQLKLKEEDYSILNFTRNLETVLDKINKSVFVVGMRFHSIVFSCNLCKPFISISYSSKNEELLSDFDLESCSIRCCYSLNKYFCKIIPLDGDLLLKQYKKLFDERNKISKRLKKELNNEKELAKINVQILNDLFK